jgi:hypothetical protein
MNGERSMYDLAALPDEHRNPAPKQPDARHGQALSR